MSENTGADPEAWGSYDSVSDDRRKVLDDLEARQQAWAKEPEATRGEPPLAGKKLTGSEVFYLAARVLAGPEGDPASVIDRLSTKYRPGAPRKRLDLDLSSLHLEGADLHLASLEEAVLRCAHLEKGDLRWVYLNRADLTGAHLERTELEGAYLELASLSETTMKQAYLYKANLQSADLFGANLEGATLNDARLEAAQAHAAHLERTKLSGAHLEGASLVGAHLEGADLWLANLEGADLSRARFDEDTRLDSTSLGPGAVQDLLDRLRRRNRNAALGDIMWRDVDLTTVPWERVRRLGDERTARFWDRDAKTEFYRNVVRAYRQVAQHLRDQGMADDADRFAYRAQIRQRGVLLRTFRLPQYLFSWFLALMAGYGYRPGRTIFWYLATIASFAYMYMQASRGWVPFWLPAPSQLASLPWYEALILSVSSFHGRGFFQPLQSLGDPVAALASIEAVIGLLIEISFIATFTQRFFGAK